MLPLPSALTCVTLLDPAVPPVLSLPGAVCKLDALTDGLFDMSLQAPRRLHDSGLSLHRSRSGFSRLITHLVPVELLGRFWSTATPVCANRIAAILSLSQTELPGLTLPGSVSQLPVTIRTPHNPAPSLRLVFPQAAHSITRAYFPVRDHRPASFSSVETLRHALWPARFPVFVSVFPSLG